jgi:hypothetical protein
MAQLRPRPSERFRIGRSCAHVSEPDRARAGFFCAGADEWTSARPLNTRMVCSGVGSSANPNKWSIIPLVAPLGLLIYGFWVSLGGQPILGNALREE